ncbi:beta-galactosidase [Formica exsecta]|uniref:beta-galactosidase n=1 Tax=Formica exsecta TaxID=72781 RepID=UPI001144253C|nr:beta-galactosidase [Formica exsecta]XP_029678913.1 beta-galactosidase [Formica exsecta]
MWSLVFVTTLALSSAVSETINLPSNDTWQYSFGVDYENNLFLLDGKPFRYVSGSFHYFRAPRQYWRDRLRKMRAAGLNAISTYVEWSLHEPEPGQFNWAGDADLVEFLNIAQEEDLLVLLRPGPYICAERDLGGLPYWLLREVPDIKLRTKDTAFMKYATRYLNQVLEKVQPLLRGNGGPIIMVQIENEYGSYNACDTEYTDMLKEVVVEKIGSKALLYTTDGASASLLRCGFVPGAYATVDFGTSVNVTNNFQSMRLYQPRGPLVNSEFYPGWLTHWGETFQRVKTEAVTKTLNEMLALGASVNIYMFYGGTNFALTSGANGGAGVYSPQITSYDYDAPLTEAGDPTDKYFAIRDVIGQYLPLPNMSLPTVSPKGNYGPVLLEPIQKLFDSRSSFVVSLAIGNRPKTFEHLSVNQGFVLYETDLPPPVFDPVILRAIAKDRALVYVDGRLSGILSRIDKIYTIPLENPYGRRLSLLVENQGRLNFGNEIHDFKGISNVTISGTPLTNWTMTGYAISDVSSLRDVITIDIDSGSLNNGPVFLRGRFTITGQPLDTFLDTTGWGKGVAFVNGHNLGRYWPLVGPQITLYVPAPYLRTGENELILLELEYVSQARKMKFQSVPNLGTGSQSSDS